jgi:hypothetical protein
MKIKILLILLFSFYLIKAQTPLDSIDFEIGTSVSRSTALYNFDFLSPYRTPDYFIDNYDLKHTAFPVISLEGLLGMKYKKWKLLGTYSFRIKSYEKNERPLDLRFPTNSDKNEFEEYEKNIYFLYNKNHSLSFGIFYRQKDYNLQVLTYKKFFSSTDTNFVWVVFRDELEINSKRIGIIFGIQKTLFHFNFGNEFYFSPFEIAKINYYDRSYDRITEEITDKSKFQTQIICNVSSNRYFPFMRLSFFYKYDKIKEGLYAQEYGILLGLKF